MQRPCWRQPSSGPAELTSGQEGVHHLAELRCMSRKGGSGLLRGQAMTFAFDDAPSRRRATPTPSAPTPPYLGEGLGEVLLAGGPGQVACERGGRGQKLKPCRSRRACAYCRCPDALTSQTVKTIAAALWLGGLAPGKGPQTEPAPVFVAYPHTASRCCLLVLPPFFSTLQSCGRLQLGAGSLAEWGTE